jgi:hypothetical protein
VKGVVTFNGEAAGLMLGVPLTYKLHILLGFTIFLISPFTRMIPHLERRWRAGLSVPALSDRAHAAHAGQGPRAGMSVTVNGVEVDASRWPSPEVAAIRELLRQRAEALGMLPAETADSEEIEGVIEHLLAREHEQ